MSQIKCREKTGELKSLSICDYGNGDVKLLLTIDIGGIDLHLFNVELSEIEVIGVSFASYELKKPDDPKKGLLFDTENPYSLQSLGRFRCENWE